MKSYESVNESKLKHGTEEDWSAALESIQDFIIFTDLDGRISFVNRVLEGLKYTRESILGLNLKSFVPKPYHSRIAQVLDTVKSSKQSGFYRTEGIGPNGKKSYYFTQVYPKIIDNEVVGFVLCSRDITEVQHEREKWQSLAESCPDIILTIEPDLRVSFINKDTWSLQKPDGIEKNHLWLFIPKKSRKIVIDSLKRVEASKSIDSCELMAPDEFGKDTWYAVTVGPRIREEKVIGYTMVAKDVGPLQFALQEAKKSNAAKTRFMANISHELRTPLTSIMGHTELLKLKGQESETREQSLQVIARNCKNLIGLIDDILVLANAEGSIGSENFTYCNAREETIKVIKKLEPQAKKNQLKISLDYDSSAHLYCWTDPKKLKKILFNLVNNGIKFTKQGSVKLSIKANQEFILFDCKDTGIGIPPENFKSIFDPFVQVYDHYDRMFAGAGLGLTISNLLAKKINGNLVLHSSQIGRGSHFRLSIPNLQNMKNKSGN